MTATTNTSSLTYHRLARLAGAMLLSTTAVLAHALTIESEGGQTGKITASGQRNAASFGRNRNAIDLEFLVGVRPSETILVAQQGRYPGRVNSTGTIGKDARMVEAVSQIVPNGWQIYTEGNIPFNRLVSWDGRHRNWPATLNSVLNQVSDRQVKIEATIDWGEREILLEAKELQVASTAETAKDAPQITSKTTAAATGPMFRLQAGQSLSTNLIEWGAREGWRVIWKAGVDYEVAHSRVYQGGFGDEGGAVEQVISDYFNAKVPLAAKFDTSSKRLEIEAVEAAN